MMEANKHRHRFRAIGVACAGGAVIGLVLLAVIAVTLPSAAKRTWEPTSPPYRAFSDASYWNTPLPEDAPTDPRSEQFIDFLQANNQANFIRLAGTDASGRWGTPIYWSSRGDPHYRVANTCGYRQPREFRDVRIPVGAEPDPTSDSAMTVYDRRRGLVYGFHRTRYHVGHDAWSACGGTVFYLESLGLDGRLAGSDQIRNRGHRGVPPPTYAVRLSEIRWGSIDHVLKIAVNAASRDHVFPMVGSDGVSTHPSAPPEGARLRIEPTIELGELDLSPAALVIARALQDYGAVIGDQSGASVSLKVENTVAEGRGRRWSGVLTATSLSAIPLDAYEVVVLGYPG
jgi:hypothetical protein